MSKEMWTSANFRAAVTVFVISVSIVIVINKFTK